MPKRRIITIIAGVALSLMSVFLIKLYIEQQRQEVIAKAKKVLEQSRAEQVSVLVAKRDIPPGTPIDSEGLEVNIIPKKSAQPQAVTSLDRVSGAVAIAPISKGEQVTLNKLGYVKQRGGLAAMTPAGRRAITISADNVSTLVGMLKPGDYVDVIAIVSVPSESEEVKKAPQMKVFPLFQNVLVLAVGQETETMLKFEVKSGQEGKKELSSLITVALTPQEANLIAFVQEQGKIRLVLRSPTDSQISIINPINWETFLGAVTPQKFPTKEPPKKEELKSEGYVEIYRGLSKERVPLLKYKE